MIAIATKFFNTTRSDNHINNRWYSASFKKFISNEFGPEAYSGGKGPKGKKENKREREQHEHITPLISRQTGQKSFCSSFSARSFYFYFRNFKTILRGNGMGARLVWQLEFPLVQKWLPIVEGGQIWSSRRYGGFRELPRLWSINVCYIYVCRNTNLPQERREKLSVHIYSLRIFSSRYASRGNLDEKAECVDSCFLLFSRFRTRKKFPFQFRFRILSDLILPQFSPLRRDKDMWTRLMEIVDNS